LPAGEQSFDLHVAVSGGDIYAALGSFTNNATSTSSVWALRLAAGQTEIHVVPGPAGTGNPLERVSTTPPTPSITLADLQIAAEGDRVDVAWQRRNNAATGNKATTNVVDASHIATLGDAFGSPLTLDTIQSTTNSAISAPPTLAAGPGHIYAL